MATVKNVGLADNLYLLRTSQMPLRFPNGIAVTLDAPMVAEVTGNQVLAALIANGVLEVAGAGNGAGGGLNPTLINGTFTNGVLHWTGGTITTPLGDVNGVMMTVPASTSITLSDTSCAVAGQQNLFVIWSTLADAVAALAAMLQNQQGLYITYAQNDKHAAVDGITRYGFAATIDQTFTASGQHIHYDYGAGQGNTPDTTQPAPTYMHVIVVDPTGGTVPDATLGLA